MKLHSCLAGECKLCGKSVKFRPSSVAALREALGHCVNFHFVWAGAKSQSSCVALFSKTTAEQQFLFEITRFNHFSVQAWIDFTNETDAFFFSCTRSMKNACLGKCGVLSPRAQALCSADFRMIPAPLRVTSHLPAIQAH